MQPSVRVDNGNDHQDPAANGNNIVQQETWVLLADELWTEDNGNDAVCNGNCMRNDYRLRIVRAISMNRELESSMVQCNDRVMITGLPVRLKSRHVDRLTWTYVTIIIVPPQYNNDNNDPCTTLLHGFAERGFNGRHTNKMYSVLNTCKCFNGLYSVLDTQIQIHIRKYRWCNMLCTDLLAWHVDTLTCTDLCNN